MRPLGVMEHGVRVSASLSSKMIKERDGVEDLVVTDANGHVEVGKGRGIHSGCRSWQHKARKWLHRPWTAPIVGRSAHTPSAYVL